MTDEDSCFLATIICRFPNSKEKGKDIVYTHSDMGLIASNYWLFANGYWLICDERTGMNEPLVYQLSRPGQRWVAMFGSDKR